MPSLVKFSAQNAHLSYAAISAVAGMEKLNKLDLEATSLNDEMAAILSTSSTIEDLGIGASRVTAKGLKSICAMTQLRELDIWALDIQEADLEMLAALPNLEYLSVGGYDDQTVLTAKGVLPRLTEIPSLKRIWLDGIPLTEKEKAELEERYDHVQN